MALNWEATDTHYFVDREHHMMLTQNPGGDSSHNSGKGDSIGRTFISYFTYEDERFLQGIESCWVKKERNWFWKLLGKKYYYQGYRFPTHYDKDMSRDHLIYSILAFKYSGFYSKAKLKEFVKHLRFKISERFNFSITSWLWARAVSGSKFYKWLFYVIELPYFKVLRFWHKLIYKLGSFGEESSQRDWVRMPNEAKPKIIDKMSSLLYPVYTLHQQAWRLFLLPDSKKKSKLQKICLGMASKHNYVIKILLGDKESFTKEDVWDYKSMTGGRWTGILNPWLNDRALDIITDEKLLEYNVQDVDYVRKLYDVIVNEGADCKTN